MNDAAPPPTPDEERPCISLTFNYGPLDRDEGVPYRVRLPLDVAWDVVEVIQVIGYERALTFANFAIIVANAGHTDVPPPHGDELLKLRIAIGYLGGVFGQGLISFEDRVLAFTYQMLRHRAMDRKLAAKFASSKLRKHVDSGTWQKRVDRWARRHNLPKVGLRRRPPKT